MADDSRSVLRASSGFVWRSTVLHVLTYFVIGAASYWLVARRYWTGAEALPWLRDPEGDFVQRFIMPAQILRGVLHGVALFPLRGALLAMGGWGGSVIASLLLLVGLIAGIAGVIEDSLYTTTFHAGLFLAHLPEVVVQAFLYGYLLLAWERRRGHRTASKPATREGRTERHPFVQATHGVRYQVKDVARSVAFYTTHLGFTLGHQQLPAFANVSLGDTQVLLSGPEASGSRPMPDGRRQEPGGWNRVVLRVGDLAAFVDVLKEAGLRFRNNMETGPGGRQIQVEDPDGNPIELFEPARARPERP
jgi:glyoxylase I family protein